MAASNADNTLSHHLPYRRKKLPCCLAASASESASASASASESEVSAPSASDFLSLPPSVSLPLSLKNRRGLGRAMTDAQIFPDRPRSSSPWYRSQTRNTSSADLRSQDQDQDQDQDVTTVSHHRGPTGQRNIEGLAISGSQERRRKWNALFFFCCCSACSG